MMKIFLLLATLYTILFSNDVSLQFTGIKMHYTNGQGEKKQITIEREIDPQCLGIPISNDVFWKSKYADKKVPDVCKSTFITSAGKTIFPMKIHKKIETYGEVEVMAYIKNMQHNNTMLLIDTRDEAWYEYRTIPGALNIHYVYIMKPKIFKKEYKEALVKLGIVGTKKPFDFSQAKTILLFCNGAWCSQSPKMAKALLALGYPSEKIKWYRGGMDDWLGLSMTSTRK